MLYPNFRQCLGHRKEMYIFVVPEFQTVSWAPSVGCWASAGRGPRNQTEGLRDEVEHEIPLAILERDPQVGMRDSVYRIT